MNHDEIYSYHLKNVSRSFAFCIERLNNPFKNWVSLGYILCRLLDTVEDSPWAERDQQANAFEKFESFILDLPEKGDVDGWISSFPGTIVDAEKELLKESLFFFTDLHQQPENVKTAMVRTVLDMKRGMAYWSKDGKGIRLNSAVQANQYCFFVAGIIGEMLSELFSFAEKTYQITDANLLSSIRFGFFLQKINLLKDQMGDEPQGRFLVPNREEMRQSLLSDGQGAIDYLISLPVSRKDYRIFCAWSLFLGLASLPYIDKSFKEKTPHKIPRTKTLLLLGKVEIIINNNEKLKKLYNEMLIQNFGTLTYNRKEGKAGSDDIWLYKYYRGRLSPQQMRELELVD